MSTVVRFRTGDGEFAVAVADVREIRTAAGMRSIPSSRAGVVGMLANGEAALTVVDSLGTGRDHVLVLDGGGPPFGLLVEEVTGVVTVDDHRFGPPPAGHQGDVVSGVIAFPDQLVLLIDPAAIARALSTP
jgi:chemotaxis signal transduction protein